MNKKKRQSMGILEFPLPLQKEEFVDAQNGTAYKLLIEDLDEWLRCEGKHTCRVEISIDEIREKIRFLKSEYGI